MSITLAQAERIVDAALEAARARGAKPLAAIVLDDGGHPVCFKREDGASLFRFDIARAKAMSALGMGADTAAIAARAKDNPAFFTTVAVATGGRLILSPGGVLARDADGRIVGAFGISGDTGEVDAECAGHGIAAAGLTHGAKS